MPRLNYVLEFGLLNFFFQDELVAQTLRCVLIQLDFYVKLNAQQNIVYIKSFVFDKSGTDN